MAERQSLFQRLSHGYPNLSPQLQRAAKYVLENPAEVAINSMRRVAGQAEVTPSTMLRLAKAFGFSNYERFRESFQQAVRARGEAFPDRARWLQSIAESGGAGPLFGQMATASMANVEQVYAGTDPAELAKAADVLSRARRVYVLGLRSAYSLAHYFYYVARMVLPSLVLTPGRSGLELDELADIGSEDAVLTMAFSPYTRETVMATQFATERGAAVIALTDSHVSPLAAGARHVLIAPTASPQFFPSMVASTALIETLIALIVARGGDRTIDRIATYGELHEAIGVYWNGDWSSDTKRR